MDSGIVYKWLIYHKGAQLVSSIVSTSLDPRQFRLSAYTLEANTFYVAQVTAALFDAPTIVSAPATATIVLGLSGMEVSIAGGSARTIVSTSSLKLDASASRDLDYPEDKSILSYSWSCI